MNAKDFFRRALRAISCRWCPLHTTFKQITDDIDDAGVFGGVHLRFDQEAGALMGKHVGEYVLRHTLRPVRHP